MRQPSQRAPRRGHGSLGRVLQLPHDEGSLHHEVPLLQPRRHRQLQQGEQGGGGRGSGQLAQPQEDLALLRQQHRQQVPLGARAQDQRLRVQVDMQCLTMLHNTRRRSTCTLFFL